MKRLYITARRFFLSFLDLCTKKNGVAVTINGKKIKLPGKYLRYFAKDYEQENFSFLREQLKPGITCLDIGAHIGVYSVYMKMCGAGKIFCFEPTPSSFNTLQKVIKFNNCSDLITAVPAAVAAESGKQSFYLNQSLISADDKTRVAEANSLVNADLGPRIRKQTLEVITYSIDDFCEINKLQPRFIKIDAEGSEAAILPGAKKTFLTCRPSGILGIHSFAYPDKEKTLLQIWNLLQEYNLILLHNNKPLTKDQFMTPNEDGLMDIQFIPAGD